MTASHSQTTTLRRYFLCAVVALAVSIAVQCHSRGSFFVDALVSSGHGRGQTRAGPGRSLAPFVATTATTTATATTTTLTTPSEIIASAATIQQKKRGTTKTVRSVRRTTHLFSQSTTRAQPKENRKQREGTLFFADFKKEPSISATSAAATKPKTTTERKTRKPTRTTPASAAAAAFTKGPDPSTKPDYENIHGPIGKTLDNVFLWFFRTKLAEFVGVDSKLPKTDYAGLIELTAALNARYSDREQVQTIAQKTLRSLFPSWLPGQFSILFARPFPEFSSRMNAWATYVSGTWLMGECEINDIEMDGKVYKDQGLLVKRCRFLEESGCASVCVNSCKIPTQNFFIEDMGLPLTMTPNYETHECQFSFGRLPDAQDEFDAKNTPCLTRCPTAGSMRKWHSAADRSGAPSASVAVAAVTSDNANLNVFNDDEQLYIQEISSKCVFMENSSAE